MCPPQITNDIEHLSFTLHGVNGMFICHPSNVENYSNGHKLEMGQPNKKKKFLSRVTYFYTFLQILDSQFKIPIAPAAG